MPPTALYSVSFGNRSGPRSPAVVVSTVVHVGLVLGALLATRPHPEPAVRRVITTVLQWPIAATTSSSAPVRRTPRPVIGVPSSPPASLPAPDVPMPSLDPLLPSAGGVDTRVAALPLGSGGGRSAFGPLEAGGPGRRVIEAGDVDVPPELVVPPRVRYPRGLRNAGLEGRVDLEFVIDTAGRVEPSGIRVLAATHRGFVRAAIRALRAARYRPARVGGTLVRVRVRQSIGFRLVGSGRQESAAPTDREDRIRLSSFCNLWPMVPPLVGTNGGVEYREGQPVRRRRV